MPVIQIPTVHNIKFNLSVVLTGISRFLQVKLDEKKKKDAAPAEEGKDVKGIPEFWLTTFKNVEMVQEMILEHDEPILEKLTDVTVSFSEKPMVIQHVIGLLHTTHVFAFFLNKNIFF